MKEKYKTKCRLLEIYAKFHTRKFARLANLIYLCKNYRIPLKM